MKVIFQQRPEGSEHSRLREDQVSTTRWVCLSYLKDSMRTLCLGKKVSETELREIRSEK